MKQHYNALVFAYGAESEQELGIPGSNLVGVSSARSFVNWYNAHPYHAANKYDLSCESAVVIG